jgi:signal transduction histidine kinase
MKKNPNPNGCGIGLNLSNSLAKLLAGDKKRGISVESEVGVGSCFSFIIESYDRINSKA